MSPFSMALTSGRRRQSVGASTFSMPGSSSFRDMVKLVKLYICTEKDRETETADLAEGVYIAKLVKPFEMTE